MRPNCRYYDLELLVKLPNNRFSAFTDEEGDQTDVVYTPHGLAQVVTDPAGDAGTP